MSKPTNDNEKRPPLGELAERGLGYMMELGLISEQEAALLPDSEPREPRELPKVSLPPIWPAWLDRPLVLHDAIADDAVRLLGWTEGVQFVRLERLTADGRD